MRELQKYYWKLIFISGLLLPFKTGILNAQTKTDRNYNFPICNEYIGTKPEIKKSAIIGSPDLDELLKGNGIDDYDIIVRDIEITEDLEIPFWKNVIDNIHKQGKLFYAHLKPLTHLGKTYEYIMNDKGIQDAITVDVNFNAIQTPWMKERSYKNVSVKMYCGNNPAYRAYLRQQIYLMSQIGVDGIMVDDYTGGPESYGLGGCFCQHCMAGFRTYLKEKYNSDQLKELGIDNIDTFDYRELVLKHADDVNSLKIARSEGEVPLDKDFHYFLFKSDSDFFASLKEMACRLSGRYIEMGWDNVNFINNRAIYYDYLDAFFTETAYQRMGLTPYFSFSDLTTPGVVSVKDFKNQTNDEFIPPEMVYIYKLSDALNKWFVPMPAPPSWGAFKIKNMTGLLRIWISFSYANGAHFKYPTKGWCYGPTSRWYYPPKEEFEAVYSFIRNNKDLFDDYKAFEQIAVLYSHQNSTQIKYVCGQLVNLNIPFGTPVAGDLWLSNRIKEDDIDPYELVLIPDPYSIYGDQKEIIKKWNEKKSLIYVKNGDDVQQLLEGRINQLISVDPDKKIWAFPRYNPESKKNPLICHLVNYDYDAIKNQNKLQEDLKISFNKQLLDGARVKAVTYYTIDKSPVKADFSIQGDIINVMVPELDLWGILKIEKK